MSIVNRALLGLLLLSTAAARPQGYEKISVKPAHSIGPQSRRVQILPNGDLVATSVPAITLLSYAYGVPSNPSPRLLSLPDWTIGERYDIEAKAPANAIPANLPDNKTQERIKEMIRQMLASRFHLAMHTENQRMPVYVLAVSSHGPNLQKSTLTPKDCVFDTGPQGCHHFAIGFGHPLIANAVSMDDLAEYIENWTGRPVVNCTNISGLYTLNTGGWLPMRLPPPPPNTTPAPGALASLPSIFTVLGKLGLELHRQQEVRPVYTIEHMDHPATN